MTLFDNNRKEQLKTVAPLAARMRPENFKEFINIYKERYRVASSTLLCLRFAFCVYPKLIPNMFDKGNLKLKQKQ